MQYIVETADIPWRADRAEKRIEEYARKHSPRDPSKVYKLAYAFHPVRGDGDLGKRGRNNPDLYKLPVMDVINGQLTLIPKAVASAKGYLHGARGVQMHGTDAQKRHATLLLAEYTAQIEACKIKTELMDGYSYRKGLEGPFRFRSGKVLYYDPREGAYYDPSTDMYIDDDEFAAHQSGRRSNPAQSKPLKFKHKGDSGAFRVSIFGGRGYIEIFEKLSLRECQPDIDRLIQSREYRAAAKVYAESRPPNTALVRNEATGKYEVVEVGPAVMRPKVYVVDKAFINDPELRGKGYGKALYNEAIRKAAEYAGDEGAFIAPLQCSLGSGTSPDAQRVWKSLSRDYLSSGDVVYVNREAGIGAENPRR